MAGFENKEWKNPDPGEIKQILRDSHIIAVVGLSPNPERPSYGVAQYLISQGYEVIPVNPGYPEIFGMKSYSDLRSIGKKIDLVDIFRKPESTPEIVREAIAIESRFIWLQEGIISLEAYNLATGAGIPIVMDKCVKKEHQKLGE